MREVLYCPWCGSQHVDRRWWAYRPHKVHVCQNVTCGKRWDQGYPSIGIREAA